MVGTGIKNAVELGIGDFLRDRARGAMDSRLAVDVCVGLAAIVVAASLRPALWLLLASAGLCLASFGAWAAVERICDRPSHSPRFDLPLAVARYLFATMGVGAAISTGFFLWTALMGTWIR